MTSKPSSKQAQLQAQLEAQGQLQGQGQGQGQLQGQGQGQGQWQYAGVASESANHNANGNENGNFSANLSENANCNANENGNLNVNVNENLVKVDVDVKVDLSSYLTSAADNDAIDIDRIEHFEQGIVLPDVVHQTVESGNNFNIDQVSNLTDNDHLSNPSVSYENAGLDAGWKCCGGAADLAGDFKMTATANGGSAISNVGDIVGDDGTFSGIGAAAANATLTQEAFTQNIAMGANIQFHSIDQTVVGGDLSDAF